jgi:plastocyanin
MRLPHQLAALAFASLLLSAPVALAKGSDDEVRIVEDGDISSWDYHPSPLSVPVGTTVTWKNVGGQAHSVTSQDQLFDSRLLDANKSWSYTFEMPGTYRYFCVPHPWMKGSIVVTADERGKRAEVETSRENDRDKRAEVETSRENDRDRRDDSSTGRENERSSARDNTVQGPIIPVIP